MNEALYHYQRDEEEKAYRVYSTEVLRLMCENTAKLCRLDGKYISVKFSSIYEDKPIDYRTEAEIKAGIYSKLQEIGKEGD